MNRPDREVGQSGVLQVGDDLFDHRVAAVLGLGIDQAQWVVGEDRVVAKQQEPWVLAGQIGRIQFRDAAHDQPAALLLPCGVVTVMIPPVPNGDWCDDTWRVDAVRRTPDGLEGSGSLAA